MEKPTLIERLERIRAQIHKIETTIYPDRMLDTRKQMLTELYRRVFFIESQLNSPDAP